MTIDEIGEFGLIERLTARLTRQSERLLLGVGDDAAVIRTSSGLLLATSDIQMNGVHFDSRFYTAEQVGRKAAAVNLSDIAAMGGVPTVALVSLAVPPQTDVKFLEGIYVGLTSEFDRFGVEIAGGNTARSPGPLAVDVTLLGEVSEENLLRRSGAEVGDLLCVTGKLGASAAGLELLENPELQLDDASRSSALQAHRTPTARVAEGQYLGSVRGVTACMDISDGLFGDAHHMAKASNVSLRIDLEKIPVARAVLELAEVTARDSFALALGGGEDYELLFTTSNENVNSLLEGLATHTGTQARVIGKVTEGAPSVMIYKKGKSTSFEGKSFDHFSSSLKVLY